MHGVEWSYFPLMKGYHEGGVKWREMVWVKVFSLPADCRRRAFRILSDLLGTTRNPYTIYEHVS